MIGEKAYQHALRRRADLRDELQKVPAYQQLQEVEAFLTLCERFAGAEQNNPPRTTKVDSDKPALHPESLVGAADLGRHQMIEVGGVALRSHMRKAILDEGRPLSRVATVQALNSRGVRVAGSDQVVNAGTALWRAKDEFINLKSHGYWPRDVAYPPAGYHPEQDHDAEPNDGRNHEENGSATAAKKNYDVDLWRAVDTP